MFAFLFYFCYIYIKNSGDNMKKKCIYIALSIMIIGLATMTTTLFINGGVKIASLEEDFEIYFSSAILDGVDKTNMFVNEDKQHITFETNKLKRVGDTSTLEFEVTNNSTQYDAHVDISCNSDIEEYVTLTTSENSLDIVAQTRKTGSIFVTLIKGTDKFIDGTIICSLNATAKERKTRLEKTLVDLDYQITGTLLDDEGKPLEDKNLVVFSDTPHYVITDNYGFFYVTGLEKGSHEIYYMGDEDNLETKSIEEIKASSLDSASLTTSDTKIKFNDILLDEFIVEPVKTGKVDITFNANGGSETETKKVDLYTRAKDLPIPTRIGYTFKGWIYNDKMISPNTIINNNKELKATWEIKTYCVELTGNNFNANKANVDIEYNGSGRVIISPASGYYVSLVSCTNGYTTNAKFGTGITTEQEIIISNNGNDNASICTVDTHASSYNASVRNADPIYHVHTGSMYSGGGCYGSNKEYCSGTWENPHDTDLTCGSCPIYHDGDPYYESKIGESCGGYITVSTYHLTCGKTTSTIDGYKCNNDETLNSNKCYSCPKGGTLSGTTCVFN